MPFINEILTDIRECIEFMCNDIIFDLEDISESWIKSSQIYAELVEKTNEAKKATLNPELLERFPDIQMKLVRQFQHHEHKELSTLQSVVKRLRKSILSLKIKCDGIHSKLDDNLASFLKHKDVRYSIREIVTWIKDCWLSLHRLYTQLKFALVAVEVLDKNAVANLVDAIKQDEEQKSIIGKAQNRLQMCLMLLKYNESKSKIIF